MLCLSLILTTVVRAQGDITASWDFENDLPVGIQSATNYQGVTADIPSTVEGIVMHVDATNGKLYCIGRNNAQFNSGTVLQVPVKSTQDLVTVKAYPGYNKLNIGGVAMVENEETHRATSAEAAQGYVEVVSTGGSYIYKVEVVQVSMIQEKQLYATDFSDWELLSASTSESNVEQKTKYSNENLTFTLYNTACNPAGQNDKFNDKLPLGWLQAQKAADPYIQTSKLASVTKVRYVHAATGSNRGWKMLVKGDGDTDWVTVSDAVASPASWSEVNVNVNRTNVQLRWENLNASQNAYMFQLDIYGNVDLSATPTLGTFSVNGVQYAAADIFDEQADGTNTAQIEISKSETLVSAENPLTDITADNGEVTSVDYVVEGTTTKVTIKVKAGEDEKVYVLTVVQKPDFTLTYYGTGGNVLGTQTVEKDAAITAFGCEYTEELPTNHVFRGWYAKADGGRRFTLEDVVTSDLSLYALVTKNELTVADDERLFFNLTDIYFYDEDHEGFNLIGTGCFHDGQHGWTVNAGDKVELAVKGHAYIVLGLCRYGGASDITLTDSKGNVIGTVAAPVSTDGQSASFEYSGDADVLTLTVSSGIYLHNVTVINDASNSITQNEAGYFVVKAGDANNFLATLEVANAKSNDNARTMIFVPDGTYDLGTKALTAVSGNNISIIGQSMDKTIIVNAPEQEGIGVTATLLITGKNTYLQDLTLQNALDYYNSGSAGRAVCLQDKGSRTICKNVRMLSYQDTYYSNANSQFYWETSEIHGCVDFICGGGDVYFNECLLVCKSRKQNEKNGEATITAPYTDASNKYGYVFSNCTVENEAASYNFGRAWGGVPRLAFLNTVLNQPSEIAAKRFTQAGMNVAADKFVEYNSLDTKGNVVSPASNVLTFTKDKTSNTMETILTAEQAGEYSLDKVFTDWTPASDAAQVKVNSLTANGAELTWDNAGEGTLYAVFLNDNLLGFTSANSYVFTEGTEGEFSVRCANGMGGFGEKVTVQVATGIRNIVQNTHAATNKVYTLHGVEVNKAGKGLYIINGKKVIR